MGMFDTLYVAQSLLEKAIENTDISLKYTNEYYSFQTKDLDNSLTSFYLKEDGSFCYEYQDQEWVSIDSNDKNNSWRSGYMKPIGEPKMVPDLRSTYLDFYDFYYTDTERIWLTFTAHIKEGKLVDNIILKEISKTDLEEEAIANKKNREEWNKVCATWQWRLATFIFDIRSKIKKSLYPLSSKLDTLDSYLRKEAKKTHNYE